MEKMKMESANLTDMNIDKIAALFPNCITETADENGKLKKAINFDMLRAMLSEDIAEGDEAYEFTWVGKKAAIAEANRPIRKALRPCVEESVNWDSTENLYIEGDNLEVLKLLQESYLGKVKMIYIDPPYNTGNDFIYRDDFAVSADDYAEESGQLDEDGNRLFKNTDSNGRFHSDWCSMIYSRLMLARNLLSDDGVIFISIDDNEFYNLKEICDEVFGVSNYVCPILWQSKSGGAHDERYIVNEAEYALVYAKNKPELHLSRRIYIDDKYNLSDEYQSRRGNYLLNKLDRRMTSNHYTDSLNYAITMPDGSLIYPGGTTEKNNLGWNWRWSKDKVEWGIKTGFIVFKQSNGKWSVYSKQYERVDNNDKIIERTVPYRNMYLSSDFSTTQASGEMIDTFGFKMFEYAKPTKYIKQFITISNLSANDIVLDFFSGSATTAHAVMQLNAEDGGHRKFIMVQLPEKTDESSEAFKAGYKNICEIGKERIRRAGAKIESETGADIDYGFRVLKLDDTNMQDVYYTPAETTQTMLAGFESNIKPDRTDLDLLFGCLLDWGLPLSMPYSSEQIEGVTVHTYNDGDLIACFDKAIPESVIKTVAKRQPLRVVFRDDSFADSPSKINVSEIFKMLSPDTRVKVI